MKLKGDERRLIYIAVALVALGAVYYTQRGDGESVYGDVTAVEAYVIIQDKPELVILDVRTVEEYDDGHLEGAVNIPVQELADRLDELDRGDELLVYCRTGNRSATAVQILSENGFTRVFHMMDGITAWIEAGYPVVQ